jgi:hypothetical protein
MDGRGGRAGPPLLDSLFLRRLVSDEAALRAITTGVNQRAYFYGAMPSVPRLSVVEAEQVVAYVRWLQARAWPAGSSPVTE